MEHKEIRELAAMMQELDLTVLDLNGRGESIRLERGVVNVSTAVSVPTAVTAAAAQAPVREIETADTLELFEVKSPTVGTFYAAPEAGKTPFVEVGVFVRKGDVLCLLEAMKMLNEITAEKDGVIAEICANNNQIVEFGQTLFRIDTSAQ
ncbi:MAG: acetyl-CoA carboxylase, biotin carboxyl carrier protein [Oscillospiraceae bacterium]|nr:acetyl-CoA carboxylase, biotin carboxyl carrier protein [Oscillospiraceae bacterium]